MVDEKCDFVLEMVGGVVVEKFDFVLERVDGVVEIFVTCAFVCKGLFYLGTAVADCNLEQTLAVGDWEQT